jgi:phage/plasmid-like protein (TIGR03299 family)
MPANVETMMYANEAPWHGQGTRVPAEVTAEQCIIHAGLDWEVNKVPILTKETSTEIADFFAVQRNTDNAVISVVGNRWTPIQNRRAFDFFDTIVGSGKAIYHTAGSLNNGKRIWILAKLPGDIEVGKGDGIEKFLLLANAHDGSMKCSVFFTPIRVVCQNTLSTALMSRKTNERGRKAGIEIRHTSAVEIRLKEAEQVIQAAHEHYDIFATLAKNLANTRYTPAQLSELVQRLFPATAEGKVTKKTEEKRLEVVNLFEGGAGHDKIAGSAWAAWNAVVEHVDHSKLKTQNKNNRLMDIWFGGAIDIKEQALGIIAEQILPSGFGPMLS